jgi:hypothetical protein
MPDESPETNETEKNYSVFVQQNTAEREIDEYVLPTGYKPVILSNDDRELYVNKTMDDTSSEMVALYAQGTWLCAYVLETG